MYRPVCVRPVRKPHYCFFHEVAQIYCVTLVKSDILQVLCIGYDDVALGDDYTILKSLLKTDCSGKFRLAQDFLATSSLSAAEVSLSFDPLYYTQYFVSTLKYTQYFVSILKYTQYFVSTLKK